MVDFQLTEEQKMVQETVRQWGGKWIPKIRDLDRAEKHDPQILREMAELGLLGICIPTKYGGSGMDYISLGLVCEEVEYVDSTLRVILAVHTGLNSLTLLTWGDEEQKQKYLIPQAKGEKIGAFCLTEPSAGSDVRGIQTTAIRKNKGYVLSGEKTWISLSDVADHFLVFAWTDLAKKERRDHTGISAFIVERKMNVKTYTLHGKLGVRAGNTGGVVLEEVFVPEENRLGDEGDGMRIALFSLDQGRYCLASGSAGLIRACLDASVRYAKQRSTFGATIGEHQLVKEMIAEMSLDYHIARLLYLNVGWLKNQGLSNTKETSMAKWFATEAAFKAAHYAIQIHGAYGYSDEFPVERYFRNARGATIYEGTTQIHKLLQADYALGKRADKLDRKTLPPYQHFQRS